MQTINNSLLQPSHMAWSCGTDASTVKATPGPSGLCSTLLQQLRALDLLTWLWSPELV